MQVSSELQGTLEAHHSTNRTIASEAEEGSETELVLKHILESGKFSTEEDVHKAVDEYVGGKPLAYITGWYLAYHYKTEDSIDILFYGL